MKNYNRHFVLILSAILVFSGCADLKHVNNFASSSVKGVEEFETLSVGFQKLKISSCKELDIKNDKLNPTNCNCDSAKMADSLNYLMFKAIDSYLAGLEKLSANNLTTYKFDDLSNQLTSDKLGSIKITSTQAGAYSKLAGIITKALTDGYRRAQIKQYIKEANEPLKVIIDYLKLNINRNLIVILTDEQTKLESNYFALLKVETDKYERRLIIQDYYARKSDFDKQGKELKAYAKVLQTIEDGHQKLTEEVDDLSKAQIKEVITQYASNIQDIYKQIQIIKK